MKILCIGHAAYDITFPLEQFPIENTKNRVKSRVECGGGPAANAAYLLGLWGMNVSFMGLVGHDLYGNIIKEDFEKINVDTKYLEVRDTFTTTSSFIIANTSNGTRTVITYRSEELQMNEVNIDFSPDIILIDGQEYEMSKKILTENKNAISIIDAGRPKEKIIELAKMVNYLVCSKEFAETVTNIKINYEDYNTLISIYNKMEEIFKNNIIITLESKGCLYKKDNNIKLMPSIKVTPIDSTGAGDIFHGAFTYGIANKMDIEEIVKISNIAGAISVTKIGSRYSIPTKEEMKVLYNEFR